MKTTTRYHIGIDAHKRFSQVHVLRDDGETVWKGCIDDNDPALFAGLVRQLGGPCRAVFEASMNWHVLYDAFGADEDPVPPPAPQQQAAYDAAYRFIVNNTPPP